MSNPWDRPPLPIRGDDDQDTTHAAVGSVLTNWENIEGELSHIFALYIGKMWTNEAYDQYYERGRTTKGRLQNLETAANAYFVKSPNQEAEGAFCKLLEGVFGFADRRHEPSDARKESDDLTTATVPAGTTFPAVSRDPVISLCVLRGSLVRRPVELGSINPHAVQNDRELARDGDLGLAEAVSLAELGSPSLQSRPFWHASQQNAGRFAAWRTSRFCRINRSPRRHGVGSSIRYRRRHFSIA
jgi:hypothetical protein